jgi:hypothetical protein
MNEAWFTLLGVVGPASIAFALCIIGLLSQRLGAVTRMPPYYRWFFVAAGFAGISTVCRLLSIRAELEVLGLIYTTSLAVGVTVAVVPAWRYWSWLFVEQEVQN